MIHISITPKWRIHHGPTFHGPRFRNYLLHLHTNVFRGEDTARKQASSMLSSVIWSWSQKHLKHLTVKMSKSGDSQGIPGVDSW
jgi:hypothetical protein